MKSVCVQLCVIHIVQIINVDDSSQLIVLSLSVESCGVAECTHTETFNSNDGRLEEGVTYIVSAIAVNRYGESQASGNSDPFTFTKNTGMYDCECECICAWERELHFPTEFILSLILFADTSSPTSEYAKGTM